MPNFFGNTLSDAQSAILADEQRKANQFAMLQEIAARNRAAEMNDVQQQRDIELRRDTLRQQGGQFDRDLAFRGDTAKLPWTSGMTPEQVERYRLEQQRLDDEKAYRNSAIELQKTLGGGFGLGVKPETINGFNQLTQQAREAQAAEANRRLKVMNTKTSSVLTWNSADLRRARQALEEAQGIQDLPDAQWDDAALQYVPRYQPMFAPRSVTPPTSMTGTNAPQPAMAPAGANYGNYRISVIP